MDENDIVYLSVFESFRDEPVKAGSINWSKAQLFHYIVKSGQA